MTWQSRLFSSIRVFSADLLTPPSRRASAACSTILPLKGAELGRRVGSKRKYIYNEHWP